VTDFEIALEQPSLAYMEEIPLPDPAPFHPAQRSDAADGWSLARTDYLRQRWDEGATGQQISDELGGVSRSAVLGKVRKLGLLRGKGSKRGRPALSVAQAQESAAAYASKRGNRHTRKAYAALGDDTSFSRFVKLKGVERKQEPKQLAFDARHPAFIEGRSIFSRKGVRKPADIKNLLVSGHSNVKIGNDVRVGLFKGYRIFTLTLQERATCPRSCLNWTTCYGNNMPYASRVDHTDKVEFERRLETEVETLLRKPWPGILVRLHALGDFFSVDYVNFWILMLHRYPRLAVYGYTARNRELDPIGRAVAAGKARHGRRFAIRWSDGGGELDCTVSILTKDQRPPRTFVCPEQTGKVDGCGKCGACWTIEKNVAFLIH
jgi:hypothetical protein